MNDIKNPCPSYESLVTYLYDECEPAERTSIAAHAAICPVCSEELRALGDTRAHLASWSPPALPLGFQITRTESDQPSKVLRPAGFTSRSSQSGGWWKQPLPAWAQAAAAVVIFAAGMSAGAARSGSASDPASSSASVGTAPVVATASKSDLAGFEARLRSIEQTQAEVQVQVRQASLARTEPGAVDERALMARVNAVIDRRLAQNQLQNISYLASGARDLNELAVRLDVLDERQSEMQQQAQAAGRFNLRAVKASYNGQ